MANGTVRARMVGGEYYATGKLRPGFSVVALWREPGNQYDINAIAVQLNTVKIGYLSAHFAARYAPLMDAAGQSVIRVNATIHTSGDVDVHLPAPNHPLWVGAQTSTLHQDVQPEKLTRVPAGRLVDPWGRLTCSLEVADEHLHRPELAAMMHRYGYEPDEIGSEIRDVEAHLITPRGGEPLQVGVGIAGYRIGRLCDGDERAYRAELAQVARAGQTLRVTARAWVIDDNLAVRGRVTVNMPAVGEVVPPPSMPSGPAAILPFGSKIQVTGEERYLAQLAGVLHGRLEAAVAVTLHTLAKTTARNQKTVVEVRLQGQTVGELTAATSAHFLPLIAACDDAGVPLVSRATVRGNQLKADVVLDAAKAGDLSQEWIERNVDARARTEPG